jgi:hypothetical protein
MTATSCNRCSAHPTGGLNSAHCCQQLNSNCTSCDLQPLQILLHSRYCWCFSALRRAAAAYGAAAACCNEDLLQPSSSADCSTGHVDHYQELLLQTSCRCCCLGVCCHRLLLLDASDQVPVTIHVVNAAGGGPELGLLHPGCGERRHLPVVATSQQQQQQQQQKHEYNVLAAVHAYSPACERLLRQQCAMQCTMHNAAMHNAMQCTMHNAARSMKDCPLQTSCSPAHLLYGQLHVSTNILHA